jgi:hypothetical protein
VIEPAWNSQGNHVIEECGAGSSGGRSDFAALFQDQCFGAIPRGELRRGEPAGASTDDYHIEIMH